MRPKNTIDTEYQISIYTYRILKGENSENVLQISSHQEYDRLIERIYFLYKDKVISEIPNNIKDLNTVVRLLKKLYSRILDKFLPNTLIPEISRILAYKTLGLNRIIPLLLDPNITEIFLDSLRSPLYVDHAIFGRLMTNIELTENEVRKIILLCKLESFSIISFKNPSLKTELLTDDFRFRVSIDFPPLAADGLFANFRRIKVPSMGLTSVIYSSYDALKLVILLLNLAFRNNIILAGEPGSGKTSLASILINFLPSFWRIIAIEDVRELIPPLNQARHFLRLRINPLESNYRYSKEKEIVKLLHRSPDYVIIGELQSLSDNKAFFHAISAGIKALATIHASSIFELIDRWMHVFKIDPSRIRNVDLIVTMKKKITGKAIIRGIADIFFIPRWTNKKRKKKIPIQMTIYNELTLFNLGVYKPNDETETLASKLLIHALNLMLSKKYPLRDNDFINSKINTLLPYSLKLYELITKIVRHKFPHDYLPMPSYQKKQFDELEEATKIIEKIYSLL